MKLFRFKTFFLVSFICLSFCYSEEDKKDRLQVSEDLAQVLWNIAGAYEGEYSFEEMFLNLWKLNTGKLEPKPLNECYPSLLESLEKKALEKEIFNLQAADSYLQKIKKIKGVNELVESKLYYEVINIGKGEIIKDKNSAPLISYVEKTLNDEILSEQSSGVRLPLSEMISGLRIGVEGMSVGEKRKIFIHPDFAYGEFPKPEPYSLIILEVTLLSL